MQFLTHQISRHLTKPSVDKDVQPWKLRHRWWSVDWYKTSENKSALTGKCVDALMHQLTYCKHARCCNTKEWETT